MKSKSLSEHEPPVLFLCQLLADCTTLFFPPVSMQVKLTAALSSATPDFLLDCCLYLTLTHHTSIYCTYEQYLQFQLQ